MSKFRDLMIDIQDFIEEDVFTHEEIAEKLGINILWIEEVANSMKTDAIYVD